MSKKLCGVENTIKIIGKKWTILILHNLCTGTKRFGELLALMERISPKTLAVRLDELEEASLLSRRVYAEVPLRVQYSLTKKGESLKSVIKAIETWGEQAS